MADPTPVYNSPLPIPPEMLPQPPEGDSVVILSEGNHPTANPDGVTNSSDDYTPRTQEEKAELLGVDFATPVDVAADEPYPTAAPPAEPVVPPAEETAPPERERLR